MSPLTADTKQAGRTPRRRFAENDHRIPSPPLTAAMAASPPSPIAVGDNIDGDGDDVAEAEDVDRMIVRKLQNLLEEALVIQQVQAQQSTPSATQSAVPSIPHSAARTAASIASPQSRISDKRTSRRLLLSASKAPAASPLSTASSPSAPPVLRRGGAASAVGCAGGSGQCVSLSAMIAGFLERLLTLLRLLELWMRRRLSAVQSAAVQSVKASLTSSTASLYARWTARSSSVLHGIHAAMRTPIITLHCPDLLSPLIPAFLLSPNSLAPALPSSSTPSSSPPVIVKSPPSPPCVPLSAPPPSCAEASACVVSALDAEKELLRSTISHLHALLQQQSASTSASSQLSAENTELRELIEAQEEQLSRQQAIIAEVRRELERQVRAGEGLDGVDEGESLELTVDDATVSRLLREEWGSEVDLAESR